MTHFGAVWSELTPLDTVRHALPQLNGIQLNLAWPAGTFNDLAPHANPWLLMSHSEGYWAGAENAQRFADAARGLIRKWDAASVPPATLVVDLEPPFERITGIESALRDGRVRDALQWLRRAPSATTVRAAEQTYSALVRDAHSAGWRVHLTTLPFVLDGGPRQRRVRDFLGLPVDGPDWDLVSVQAYRTLFSDFASRVLGRWGAGAFGPAVVRDYGRAAIRAFGEKAALDLGLVGPGVFPAETYTGPDDLATDLAAARNAGIPPERTHVFDLGGMLADGVQHWSNGTPRAIRRDLGTPVFRTAARVASIFLG